MNSRSILYAVALTTTFLFATEAPAAVKIASDKLFTALVNEDSQDSSRMVTTPSED